MRKCRIYEVSVRGIQIEPKFGGPQRNDRRHQGNHKKSYQRSNQAYGGRSGYKNNNNNNNKNGLLKCFLCGGFHFKRDFPQLATICANCGKIGHSLKDYWYAPKRDGNHGSGAKNNYKNNNEGKLSVAWKVFAMSNSEATT